MLYDPKWEKTTEAKQDLFSVASLIAWLETKNPEGRYCYEASGHCLISQYFKENGFPRFHCGPTHGHWYDEKHQDGPLPKNFDAIAAGWNIKPYGETFGHALERARAIGGK